jgi:hypothetical protein
MIIIIWRKSLHAIWRKGTTKKDLRHLALKATAIGRPRRTTLPKRLVMR